MHVNTALKSAFVPHCVSECNDTHVDIGWSEAMLVAVDDECWRRWRAVLFWRMVLVWQPLGDWAKETHLSHPLKCIFSQRTLPSELSTGVPTTCQNSAYNTPYQPQCLPCLVCPLPLSKSNYIWLASCSTTTFWIQSSSPCVMMLPWHAIQRDRKITIWNWTHCLLHLISQPTNTINLFNAKRERHLFQ